MNKVKTKVSKKINNAKKSNYALSNCKNSDMALMDTTTEQKANDTVCINKFKIDKRKIDEIFNHKDNLDINVTRSFITRVKSYKKSEIDMKKFIFKNVEKSQNISSYLNYNIAKDDSFESLLKYNSLSFCNNMSLDYRNLSFNFSYDICAPDLKYSIVSIFSDLDDEADYCEDLDEVILSNTAY
jgi:hypothetical protein